MRLPAKEGSVSDSGYPIIAVQKTTSPATDLTARFHCDFLAQVCRCTRKSANRKSISKQEIKGPALGMGPPCV